MRAVAESLFDTDGIRLLASRCTGCGQVTFPQQGACPASCEAPIQQVALSTTGTLWSWTSQNYLPKSPPYASGETRETFEPYAVGFIELPEGVRIQARLAGRQPEAYEIGMEMELVTVSLNDAITTYAFQPVVAP